MVLIPVLSPYGSVQHVELELQRFPLGREGFTAVLHRVGHIWNLLSRLGRTAELGVARRRREQGRTT